MRKSNKFSPEVREQSAWCKEHRGEYPSLWAAIESIAPKIGCVPQTLHEWVRRQEVDAGTRQGLTSAEHERIKALERENKELRRANEILKLASAFFAQAEQGRRLKSCRSSQPVVGVGLYLCLELARLAVRGLRHRRVCQAHRGLAGQQFHANGLA